MGSVALGCHPCYTPTKRMEVGYMNEAYVNIGPASIPGSWIGRAICWLPKKLAGTYTLNSRVTGIEQHLWATTELLQLVVAHCIAEWGEEKRERALRLIANFPMVQGGLSKLRPKGNPFNEKEIAKLRQYTSKAQAGERFSPEEARDYRDLSESAAREYAGQDWVTELLKIALFIFALYALAKLFESKSGGTI